MVLAQLRLIPLYRTARSARPRAFSFPAAAAVTCGVHLLGAERVPGATGLGYARSSASSPRGVPAARRADRHRPARRHVLPPRPGPRPGGPGRSTARSPRPEGGGIGSGNLADIRDRPGFVAVMTRGYVLSGPDRTGDRVGPDRGLLPGAAHNAADLPPTPGYRAMNSDPLGIRPRRPSGRPGRSTRRTGLPSSRASCCWRRSPLADRPGGWSMLLLAHDARDGTGSRLLGAWWLGSAGAGEAAAAFGWFVGRFGVPLRDGGREGLFYFHTPSPVPPQPPGTLDGGELHAISQTRQFVGPVGWAGASASTRKSTGLTSARSPEPSPDSASKTGAQR